MNADWRMGQVRWLLAAPLVALLAAAGCESRTIQSHPDRFVGVGLELRIEDDTPTVVRPIEDGAAAEAGIRAGDRLLSANGESLVGMPLPTVVRRLRGLEGSQVVLELARGEDRRFKAVVTRRALARSKHNANTYSNGDSESDPATESGAGAESESGAESAAESESESAAEAGAAADSDARSAGGSGD
jgi:hypothetical protein